MKNELTFHGKTMRVTLSDAAKKAATSLSTNLVIEIQVYFSCMLGKRLAFYTDQPLPGSYQLDTAQFAIILADSQPLADKLFVRFNTVMTVNCPVSDYDGPPPVTDFHIANKKPYVPDWLDVDFKNGVWRGEYGWAASDHAQRNTRQITRHAQKIK